MITRPGHVTGPEIASLDAAVAAAEGRRARRSVLPRGEGQKEKPRPTK